jgi:hypothetical protein
VAFTDGNGAQHEIPLTQLYFDDDGINADNWPLYDSYKAIVDPWLAALVAQGLLQPGPAPTGKPALLLTAREDGAGGNAVSVGFANPDATAGTVDVTASTQQNWTYLTADTLEAVLGTGSGTASQPGLVVLVVPAPAAGLMPAAGPVAPTGTPPQFVVAKQGGGTAFTLAPRYADADAASLEVTFTPDASNAWFSLSVSWSKTATGVKLTDLVDATNNPFAYLAGFAAPDGGLIGPPNAGTVTLQGGADATATKATATALQG